MDPISEYLFILVMEVLFTLIRNNAQSITISSWIRYTQLPFFYSAYADDSTFSLQNIDSMMELAKAFKQFSSFSDLSPNMS